MAYTSQVDDTNSETDPADHVYSEIDKSEDRQRKLVKHSPTKSTHSNDSNGSTRNLYEEINEDDDANRNRHESDNQSDGNYDVIDDDNDDVDKKNTSNLAPPSESEDEHSIIEQFDEVKKA